MLHLSGCLKAVSVWSKLYAVEVAMDTLIDILRGVVARAVVSKYSRLGNLHNRSVLLLFWR